MAFSKTVELLLYPQTEPKPGATDVTALRLSELDISFKVRRSRTFADNTADFEVRNPSPATLKRLCADGMRVQFSAGYADQGGALPIFDGKVHSATPKLTDVDRVVKLSCVSALSDALGSEDVVQWAKTHPLASGTSKAGVTNKDGITRVGNDARTEMATRAVNRIPVAMSHAPGTSARSILQVLSGVTGLAMYGQDQLAGVKLLNGFVYYGGVRGALTELRQKIRSSGFDLYVDNSTVLVFRLDGAADQVSTVFLDKDSGLLSLEDKTKLVVPPKLDRAGKRIVPPKAYEFTALLNPRIAPNTVVQVSASSGQFPLLIDWTEFYGDNGDGDFTTRAAGSIWSRAGGT